MIDLIIYVGRDTWIFILSFGLSASIIANLFLLYFNFLNFILLLHLVLCGVWYSIAFPTF